MQSIHSILLTGGTIGFAVGIIVATLLLAWGEKNTLKRLRNIVGVGWKIRLEAIRRKYRKMHLSYRDPFPSEDINFLLQIIDIIRKG